MDAQNDREREAEVESVALVCGYSAMALRCCRFGKSVPPGCYAFVPL
ncbi:hypothetical protein RRSWK_00011 [Rhodopirellula sp. SWK7]|nr:hypothetical protein RRSWK_00011 [Rhodopirellula sp. SWK7]